MTRLVQACENATGAAVGGAFAIEELDHARAWAASHAQLPLQAVSFSAAARLATALCVAGDHCVSPIGGCFRLPLPIILACCTLPGFKSQVGEHPVCMHACSMVRRP